MTVATEQSYEQYVSYAGQTTFLFSFQALDPNHVDVDVDANPALGFTVTLNANQESNPGGSVVFAAPLAAGLVVTVQRNTPNTQPMSYTYRSLFPAESHETALDRLTLMVQEMKGQRNIAGTARVVSALPAATEALVGVLHILRSLGSEDQLWMVVHSGAGAPVWHLISSTPAVTPPAFLHLPGEPDNTLAGLKDYLLVEVPADYVVELWSNDGAGGNAYFWRAESTHQNPPAWFGTVFQAAGEAGSFNDLVSGNGGAGTQQFGTWRYFVVAYHPTSPALKIYSRRGEVTYVDV